MTRASGLSFERDPENVGGLVMQDRDLHATAHDGYVTRIAIDGRSLDLGTWEWIKLRDRLDILHGNGETATWPVEGTNGEIWTFLYLAADAAGPAVGLVDAAELRDANLSVTIAWDDWCGTIAAAIEEGQ